MSFTVPSECYLPAAGGVCMAYFPSYYFNSKTNACEKFVYGGCGGNNNRFKSQEECLAHCVPAPSYDFAV